MSVSIETCHKLYVGADTTGPFAYDFKIFAASDLTVVKGYDDSEVETTLTLDLDYTVDGVGDEDGGDVTLTANLATGERLFIKRSPDLLQETEYPAGQRFSSQVHEDALDKIVMEIQSLSEILARAPRFRKTIAAAYRNMKFPVGDAYDLIGWNEDATELTTYPATPVEISVAPWETDDDGNIVTDRGVRIGSTMWVNDIGTWLEAEANASVDQVVLTGAVVLEANYTPTKALKIAKGGSIDTVTYSAILDLSNVSFEAGHYQVFDSAMGEVIFGTASVACIVFDWFGFDDNAFTCAFAAANDQEGFIWKGTSGKSYTITATVDWNVALPNYSTVYFDGMTITGDYEGVWFLFNDDPVTYRPTNCKITGGNFVWDDGAGGYATSAVAIQFDGVRHSEFFNIFFRYFNNNMNCDRTESLMVRKCRLNYFSGYGFRATNLGNGNTQNLQFIYNSGTQLNSPLPEYAGLSFLRVDGPTRDLKVYGNTTGNLYSEGTYQIHNSTESNSLSAFFDHNHSEGAEYPFLHAVSAGGIRGFQYISITNNRISAASDWAGTVTVFDLEFVESCRIAGNNVSYGDGATVTLVELDADCTNIVIDLEACYNDDVGTIVTYACPSSEIHIKPDLVWLTGGTVTGWVLSADKSTGDGTIDMSSVWSEWGDCLTVPTAYLMNVGASDTGSAAGVASIDLKKDISVTGTRLKSKIILDGVPNDTEFWAQMWIEADANGDIAYDIVATGAGTFHAILCPLAYRR